MFRKDADSEPGFFGFLRRHRTGLGYAYVSLLFAGALLLIQRNSDEDKERVKQNSQENAYRDCLNLQSGRQTLRDVVVVATASSSGIDLVNTPGFSDLDEATQQFFRNLTPPPSATPTTAPGEIPEPDPNNPTQAALLARAPLIVCVAPQ